MFIKRSILLLFGICLILLSAPQVNHNAVLITGWNAYRKDSGSDFHEPRPGITYDAYWNDTYLMWEILYTDTIMAWPNGNIHVLFWEGKDWDTKNPRYQSPLPHAVDITDRPAYNSNVSNVYSDLANGNDTLGIVPMDSDDNLFTWTYDHGGKCDGITSISISDPLNPSFNDDILFPYGEERPKNIEGFGEYIYGFTKMEVLICNVSDESRIQYVSKLGKKNCRDIDIKNDTGCVAGDYIYLFDLEYPEDPVYIDSLDVNGSTKRIEWGSYIYTT